LLAAWKAGAIAVSLNPMNRERERRLLFADCTPGVLVTHPETFLDAAQPALAGHPTVRVLTVSAHEDQRRGDARVLAAFADPPPPCPGTRRLAEVIATHAGQRPPPQAFTADDIALLVYTSGTTGLPTGAMNRHGNVAFTAQVYRDWIGLREADGILGIAPLFHITGLIGHVRWPSCSPRR
jgi:long-chain acyl-CoA synthetase